METFVPVINSDTDKSHCNFSSVLLIEAKLVAPKTDAAYPQRIDFLSITSLQTLQRLT